MTLEQDIRDQLTSNPDIKCSPKDNNIFSPIFPTDIEHMRVPYSEAKKKDMIEEQIKNRLGEAYLSPEKYIRKLSRDLKRS